MSIPPPRSLCLNRNIIPVYRIISATTTVFLILGTGLDMYLEKNDRNKMNGFMFDNYRYAVSSAKLQPLSEHSKIDLESGKLGFFNRYSNRLCFI